MIIGAVRTAYAEESYPYSYVLMEGNTASLLYEENGSAEIYAFHSAKLMTLLLAVEKIHSGGMTYDTVLKTSSYANSMQGAQIWLMPNEEITVDELVKAITVGNANDACVVLAEGVGGSEEKFVGMMNNRAEELGMMGTHYADCTGISLKSVTTACDIAVLASELLKYDELKPYFTTWVDSVRGGKTELASTNRLILSYNGVTGMKAYYSKDVGNCVIATAERDGIKMVCVITGEKDEYARFTTAKEKLNAGFSAYMMYQPKIGDLYTEPVAVSGGEVSEVETEISALTEFVIRKSQSERLKVELVYYKDVKAPLKKGDEVGRAVYSIDDEEVFSIPIIAKEDVKKMNLIIGLGKILGKILTM